MDDLLDTIWTLLGTGANPGAERSAFTMLQAATTALDGAPAIRTVVLRRACREARSLMFHTDVRSAKVAELKADARIALLGCDLDAGVQIRVRGMARVVDDPRETREVWESSRPRSLIVYRAPLAPATPVACPADAHAPPQSDGAQSSGFEHFCLIEMEACDIDYLHLARDGHVRAGFVYESGAWRGQWLAP
jgi:pyridoxamine 5'-phosphate oxidase